MTLYLYFRDKTSKIWIWKSEKTFPQGVNTSKQASEDGGRHWRPPSDDRSRCMSGLTATA